MAMYLSPLVDVNEIDLTTTIPAVATSIGVIILRDTWKGPELKVQLVNNIDELIDIFGRPEEAVNNIHGQSYEDIMAAAGFLQFGQNLYCTRVLAPSATFAGLYGTVEELNPTSSSSSSTSISQSSSSESSSCTQQFLDYTDPSNWEVSEVLGNPLAIWQPSASRWSSTTESGDDQVNLLPSAGTYLATAQPQQVRFTIQFKPGYSDLSMSGLNITYNDGVSTPRPDALDTGTITLSSGNPQTFTYPMNTNGYPIQQVIWRDSVETADAFWISNIEFWEDCGSSSSSSESSTGGEPA